MTSFALHTQTHPPHFHYTVALMRSICSQSVDTSLPDIFISLDSDKELSTFKKDFVPQLPFEPHLLSMETIINGENSDYPEPFLEARSRVHTPNFTWGASAKGKWIGTKRTYSILELARRGFDYVWCLDTESQAIAPFSFSEIISNNTPTPLLLACESGGPNDTRADGHLFGYDIEDPDVAKAVQCGFRQNDFWFVYTKYFVSLVEFLFDRHKCPISYFIGGCEQSLYETFIYVNYLKENINLRHVGFSADDFEDVSIPCFDMHENLLLNYAVSHDIDLEKFAEVMNKKYFSLTHSYRGDYSRRLLSSLRGRHLFEMLNINMALSNFQGL